MTGIAIVLYLNQTPSQPRERDYAYAGSFYAFAIWVGMGVAGIIKLLQDYAKMKELPTSVLVSVSVCWFPSKWQARHGMIMTVRDVTSHGFRAKLPDVFTGKRQSDHLYQW